MPNDFTTRQHLARHEAAHAVVAHEIGIQVDGSEIVDVSEDYARGRCHVSMGEGNFHPADRISMLIAGFLQNRLDGQDRLYARDVAWGDVQQIEELRDSMGGADVSWWRLYVNCARHAQWAIRASQDKIERVARELAEKNTLDAAAMGRLLANVAS